VAEVGEGRALVDLGIARQTLARCLAGLPLYQGTHAFIRERLAGHSDHPSVRRAEDAGYEASESVGKTPGSGTADEPGGEGHDE